MPVMSTIEPFHPDGNITFSQYLDQLEWIYLHQKVEPEDRKTTFLASCGTAVYSELRLLFPGQDLKDIDYKDLTEALRKRFDKSESDLVQRIKFYARVQKPNERAVDFILAVKQLAEYCQFGSFKETAIRDKLLCGILSKQLQERLLDEDDLTLAKTERIIINREQATERATLIHDEPGRISAIDRIGRKNVEFRRDPTPPSSGSRGRSRDLRHRLNDSRSPRGRSRSRSESRSGSRKRYRKTYYCTYCHREGHTRKYCYDLMRQKPSIKSVVVEAKANKSDLVDRMSRARLSDSEDEMDVLMVSASSQRSSAPCMIDPVVGGETLHMEIDSGSAVSVVCRQTFERRFGDNELSECPVKLAVVDGAHLNVVGQCKLAVQINGQRKSVALVVLESKKVFTPLFGRDWLDVFFPAWRDAFRPISVNYTSILQEEVVVEDIKSKFQNVFDNDFSTPIKDFEADLVLKDNRPVFRRAYEVPYRLKDKVIEHIDSLERDGVITPVEASEWASPVIIVVKKDQGIRMVIDCKVSINKIIVPNTYPLPVAQDLFATLSGSKIFCSLDLAGAYTQLRLSQNSRQIMIINTIKGLYSYNRLPQGASSSAAIFQKVMDQVLKGLVGVSCYLDDVLISGEDFEDCKKKLYLVLERLSKFNIKVHLKKCKFFVSSLPYLGHVLTDSGLLPCPEKVETIRRAIAPKNVTELKAFLGLVNYYGRFIPNLSSHLSNLYNLLRKDTKFVWGKDCEKSFTNCKNLLLNSNLLEYYDPDKPIVVVSDACGYGLGGVIAHVVGKEERPISFTSFSLNDAQKSYPILHLEALAIVSTIKKFHKYLYGKKFTVYTDHKPLIGIFGKDGKNAIFVTRLQRYIMELSIYDFDIVYRPSSQMGNADFCSRFPLPQEIPKELQRDCVKNINITAELPLDWTMIAKQTECDEFLKQVICFLQNGWPKKLDKKFKDVYSHHQDLELLNGCLLFQDRVVIPGRLQSSVLKLLHRNHSGILKIKQLARRTVYWYGINSDIESFVKSCHICNQMSVSSKKPSHTSWIPTNRPFSRIHADFFYFDQKVFLIMVDSYSRWLEVELMKIGTDAKRVKSKFMSLFARFGLPDVIVTDGGPPFNSSYLIDFWEKQGIKVMKSPPYHPSSNGQAERMVRVVKDVLKKFLLDPQMKGLDLEDQVSCFLFNYRNTCTEDSRFPSEKLFNFKPKTILDLVNPKNSYKTHLTTQKEEKSTGFIVDDCERDEFSKLRTGDPIYFKNFKPTDIKRWLDATFLKKISPNVFQVSLGGRTYTAHRDQIKLRYRRPSNIVCRWEDDNTDGRKRAREKSDVSDSDEDFYGFVSDSCLFDSRYGNSLSCASTSGNSLPIERSGNSLPMRSHASNDSESHQQQSTSRMSRNSERSNEASVSTLPIHDAAESTLTSNRRSGRKRNQDTAFGYQNELNLRRSLRSKRKKNNREYLYY